MAHECKWGVDCNLYHLGEKIRERLQLMKAKLERTKAVDNG